MTLGMAYLGGGWFHRGAGGGQGGTGGGNAVTADELGLFVQTPGHLGRIDQTQLLCHGSHLPRGV